MTLEELLAELNNEYILLGHPSKAMDMAIQAVEGLKKAAEKYDEQLKGKAPSEFSNGYLMCLCEIQGKIEGLVE